MQWLTTPVVLSSACTSAMAQSATAPSGTTVLSPIVVQTPSEPAPRSAPARVAPVRAPSQSSAPAVAPATPATAPSAFDALTTSGEKQAARIYDAPGTITVKSAAELERQTINSPRDLVRDEPGVSFGNQPTRGGGSNYVIRGIGENRVRIEVDGVKVPDFPGTNAGSPTGYTRDFVDLDAVKRVEIIRGPASALYGSDAIGGVVSYVTKDPADYLALVGKDWFTSIKGGFDTADRSLFTTMTGANRIGAFDSMLLVTRRWGHETTPNGALAPNPQSYMTTNVLGKIVYNCAGCGQFGLTGEFLNKSIGTDIHTDLSSTVLSSTGDDSNQRKRLSLDWNSPVQWPVADAIKTKVYGTEVTSEELSDQRRLSGGQQLLRRSDFDFDQTILGGEVQLSARRLAFGGEHFITYGANLDRTDTSRPRNRYQTDLVTGATTMTISGETFPNKNFPDTQTTMAAAYVQDVATWGALSVIPAVRFDLYDLKVKPDALFANSNTGGFAINDLTATAISPKLGLTYDLTDQLRLFGQYAHGFRGPPYDNANFGFRNPVFGYEILPNGSLKPETVDGFEGGIRGRNSAGSSFQLSAFHNSYKNFIDTVVIGTSSAGLQQFQYQNLSNVTIYGAEAKGEYRFLPEWSLFGSLAYAHGTNDDTGAPINSVDPLKAIGGLRYRGISGWGGELRTTWVAEKNRVSAPGIFVVPAHTTVDALLSYEVAPTLTINAGLFNIFNTSYFNPTDVAGVSASNPLLELYRAPGRSASANVTLRW